VSAVDSALLTDLYQLTMANAYFQRGMHETAVFELFTRRLPRCRRFLIAAGLAPALEYLQALHFDARELQFLAGLELFAPAFLDQLATMKFSGSVHAMPEGTPCFANEPILRITAPIIEAQLVESRIINLVQYQTMIASKAARCYLVAQGKRLIDFGMRRAHGSEAAVYASRAAYLAGFDATATVEAGRRFDIPLAGTMAHSFVEAHDSEEQAFRTFLASRSRPSTLLIDTYDTERAAARVADLAREYRASGSSASVQGVRIDSGNLAELAIAVRRIFDQRDCPELQIALSGNLDEYRIADVLAAGAPVDAFGVGTALDVSADAPSLDIAYKLQEYAGVARKKHSPGKVTWPGRKQVFRERDGSGQLLGDQIGLVDEMLDGEPLLQEVMRAGRPIAAQPSLSGIRQYCLARLGELPAPLRTLDETAMRYPVRISAALQSLSDRLDSQRH
jgi:nicotinate phosphoribosyltransferase